MLHSLRLSLFHYLPIVSLLTITHMCIVATDFNIHKMYVRLQLLLSDVLGVGRSFGLHRHKRVENRKIAETSKTFPYI